MKKYSPKNKWKCLTLTANKIEAVKEVKEVEGVGIVNKMVENLMIIVIMVTLLQELFLDIFFVLFFRYNGNKFIYFFFLFHWKFS